MGGGGRNFHNGWIFPLHDVINPRHVDRLLVAAQTEWDVLVDFHDHLLRLRDGRRGDGIAHAEVEIPLRIHRPGVHKDVIIITVLPDDSGSLMVGHGNIAAEPLLMQSPADSGHMPVVVDEMFSMRVRLDKLGDLGDADAIDPHVRQLFRARGEGFIERFRPKGEFREEDFISGMDHGRHLGGGSQLFLVLFLVQFFHGSGLPSSNYLFKWMKTRQECELQPLCGFMFAKAGVRPKNVNET